ncbi:MAG: hypothetical protein M5U19_11810 [Microthrixaceae bacterium]|nr:hypothetical protein [Microthrixaceae bacterium]
MSYTWEVDAPEPFGVPSPKSQVYVRPVPVPTLEPLESKLTVMGASPMVGDALATATGAPVVVVVPPPPGWGARKCNQRQEPDHG